MIGQSIKFEDTGLTMFNTKMGYIVESNLENNVKQGTTLMIRSIQSASTNDEELHQQFIKFWELEEVQDSPNILQKKRNVRSISWKISVEMKTADSSCDSRSKQS